MNSSLKKISVAQSVSPHGYICVKTIVRLGSHFYAIIQTFYHSYAILFSSEATILYSVQGISNQP